MGLQIYKLFSEIAIFAVLQNFTVRLRFKILFMAVAPLLPACGGSTAGHSVADSVPPSDTLPLSAVREVALPDTAFESLRPVRFDVIVADSSDDGRIGAAPDLYAACGGALTFRRGPRRDAGFGGRLDSVPSSIEVDWRFITAEDYSETDYGSWGGGTGWTGQPLLVQWPDSCLKKFARAGVGAVPRREIIVGSLSGNVYFIDFDTGKASRRSIATGNPIKGTGSVDPLFNGNLYIGQGVKARSQVKALVIDLYRGGITDSVGFDPRARRGWTAWDSSPLRVGRFLFWPGENGILYKFSVGSGRLRLHSALRYSVGGAYPGMEASMAVYRNYGYTADNAGNILCVNLDTMHPVWRYKLPDDIDSTPVVVEESGGVYLYTGSEVEHEGVENAVFVKLDALTGRAVWTASRPAMRFDIDGKHFDGGYYATALPGSGDCSHVIFNNVVLNVDDSRNGAFVAFDRRTGKELYTVRLDYYAWSSPVGFLGPDNKQYVFVADCSGRCYLFSGIDGRLICKKLIGHNFESSPVVSGNHLVVGSRGNTIFKLSVK